MGSLKGHVGPGFGFIIIGLWHLFNQIKLHAKNPNSFYCPSWFPFPKMRYLELYLIIMGSSISISMELFIGPSKHQPLDVDGTIPTNHLHNFEHSSISMSLLIYAVSCIVLDRPRAKAKDSLTQLLASIAFGLELLMFHLHSTDHAGLEGHYHMLLQIVILVSLATTLIGIGHPRSFILCFLRSLSIIFQGIWLEVIGFMIWTPGFVPKGCFLVWEEGHQVVHCHDSASLHRGKALVNLEFSWYVMGMAVFAVSFYLFLTRIYGEKVEYWTLGKDDDDEKENLTDDVESQKKNNKLGFIHMEKGFSAMDIER